MDKGEDGRSMTELINEFHVENSWAVLTLSHMKTNLQEFALRPSSLYPRKNLVNKSSDAILLHKNNLWIFDILLYAGMIQLRGWRAWRKSGYHKPMLVRDEEERAESHPGFVFTCLPVIDFNTKWPAIRFQVKMNRLRKIQLNQEIILMFNYILYECLRTRVGKMAN